MVMSLCMDVWAFVLVPHVTGCYWVAAGVYRGEREAVRGLGGLFRGACVRFWVLGFGCSFYAIGSWGVGGLALALDE